jgi:hypothetical protein
MGWSGVTTNADNVTFRSSRRYGARLSKPPIGEVTDRRLDERNFLKLSQ